MFKVAQRFVYIQEFYLNSSQKASALIISILEARYSKSFPGTHQKYERSSSFLSLPIRLLISLNLLFLEI